MYDEAGYLGNARWIAGNDHWPMPFSPAYAIGYPLVLAPVFAVVTDPDGQWRLALGINALLLASVLPLLFLTLRRVVGVARRPALIAAAVGALVPAVIAAGISAIAENLVLPLVLASVLAAWSMADPQRGRASRLWFGPAVCALYLAHPRFTLVVPVAIVVLLVCWIGRRVDRSVLAVNGGLLLIGTLGARALNQAVQTSRWARVDRPEGGLDEWRPLVTTRWGLSELLTTAIGQAWYLLVGSFGLVLIGMALVAATVLGRRRGQAPSDPALHDLPDRPAGDEAATPSEASRGEPAEASDWARRLALAYVAAAALVVFGTSVLFFARNQFRVDHFVYGRHNDSFTPLWLGIAVAYLLTEPALGRRLRAVALPIIPITLCGLLLVRNRDPLAFDGRISPFAVPAVVKMLTAVADRAFLVATLLSITGIVILLGMIALERLPTTPRRAQAISHALIAGLLGGWFVLCGVAIADGTNTFEEVSYVDWTAPEGIERLEIDHLAINASAVLSRATLTFPFALPDVQFTTYEGAWGEQPTGPYVLSTLDDPVRRAEGDRIVLLDQGGLYEDSGSPEGLAIWVRPGPEQDRLDAAGALLPAGFPTALPVEARRTTIVIHERAGDEIRVAAGDQIPLDVTVEHTGTGSPWPDRESYALPGYVRIGTTITPLDPGGVPGASSGGELPRWMLPGDSFPTPVQVVAVDGMLAPLPPGRYRVELGVSQHGMGWTADGGPEASFTMVVTPRR